MRQYFIVFAEFILPKENIMAITLLLDCKLFFLSVKKFLSHFRGKRKLPVTTIPGMFMTSANLDWIVETQL